MNIPRSALQRRRFIQSGSVLAAGALSTVLTGRKFFDVPSSRRPQSAPSTVASADEFLDPPEPEILHLDPSGEPAPDAPPPPPLEYEDEYAEFLASLDLRHLSPDEIITPHRGVVNGVANTLPPKAAWEKLVPTLRAADEIRERLELPLCRITSAYRSPKYNAMIPGAVSRSYHTRNQALDVVYYCSPRKAYDMALRLRREGFFRGGIGLYPTFIHLDTRGYSATWRRV